MELFRIGFLPITIVDLIDIFFVAYLFYNAYIFLKGTMASRMVLGLIIIFIVSIFTELLDMSASWWIFSKLQTVWLIAFVIIFQPELRRFLLYIGQNPVVRRIVQSHSVGFLKEVVDACEELSRKNIGALIVIAKRAGLKGIVETGVPLEARVSRQLFTSIFNPRSPLHDGAVVIQNEIMEAAKCILPLTSNPNLGRTLGTRHRAAIGLTEQTDALVVVVSEETGKISIAEDGKIEIGLSLKSLETKLKESYTHQHTEKKSLHDIFNLETR